MSKEQYKKEALEQFKETIKSIATKTLQHDLQCNIGYELRQIIEAELQGRIDGRLEFRGRAICS